MILVVLATWLLLSVLTAAVFVAVARGARVGQMETADRPLVGVSWSAE